MGIMFFKAITCLDSTTLWCVGWTLIERRSAIQNKRKWCYCLTWTCLGLDPASSELNGKVPPDASGAGNTRGIDITISFACFSHRVGLITGKGTSVKIEELV